MKEQRVTFQCDGLSLEGLLAIKSAARTARGAVVCHPHPQYGGSMHNNVVEAMLEALWKAGFATLRFNFRGVESSEGEFDGGAGEARDAQAAVRFLASQAGVASDRVMLAGYSFGAAVALRAGSQMREVTELLAVAPPVAMMGLSPGSGFAKPLALVAGDGDGYCPVAKLQALQKEIGASAHLAVVEGADHFFGGLEEELSTRIGELIAAH